MNETRRDRTPEQVMEAALDKVLDDLPEHAVEWVTVGASEFVLRFVAALRAEGFAVVPVEPTDRMVEAGLAAVSEFGLNFSDVANVVRAAVAANEEGE